MLILQTSNLEMPLVNSRYISSDFGLIHMVGLDLNNLDAGQVGRQRVIVC